MNTRNTKVVDDLRTFALQLPGAFEATPWGESVARVKKGIFVYFGRSDEEKAQASDKKQGHIGKPGDYSLSLKLPESGRGQIASGLGRPTEYGLGAKGWVTLTYPAGKALPASELKQLIEESYRAVAPPTLVRELDARSEAPAKSKAPKRSR